MQAKLKALNLGCGQFHKKGYVNADVDSSTKADVVCDLAIFPWPFADDEFDLIEAEHVLEHLSDPFAAMKELARILKPCGELRVKVPHFSRGFTHPDHKRGFDVSFPCYFSPTFKGGYTGIELKLQKMKLCWFSQPHLKRTVLPAPLYWIGAAGGWFFDLLSNISPFFCSRCWAFWVGGFEEIEFHFRKPEKQVL